MPRLDDTRGQIALAFAAIVAGILYPLGFAPIGWWPLTLLSLAIFIGITRWSVRPVLTGFLFGLGLFGAGASWVYVSIHDFGHAAWPIAGMLTALFVIYLALYPALSVFFFRRLEHWIPVHDKPLMWALIWCLLEAVRSELFGGFGWLRAGYSLTTQPWGAWAPVIGEAGILFFVVLSAALVGLNSKSRTSWLLVAMFWIAGPVLDRLRWSAPVDEPVMVTVVQPSVTQDIKWTEQGLHTLVSRLVEHTYAAPPGVIVWPETAVPQTLGWLQHHLARTVRQLTGQDKQLVTGIVLQEDGHYYNGVVLLDETAAVVSSYRKRRLVPFGEYVPFEAWLRGIIKFFDLPMSSFQPGQPKQPLLKVSGQPVGTAICYEMAFPELVWPDAREAGWLLTVSNDAWFGDSFGPWQNLQIAQMRARETALPVVRATNSGVSAFIAPDGSIEKQLPLFVNQRLSHRITPMRSVAPVLRWPWLPTFLWIGFALWLVAKNGPNNKNRAPSSKKTYSEVGDR